MRLTELLLARPWRLVLVVALLIALPMLLVGELSASDTRERIRAAELDALATAANRAAASLSDRIETIADQVEAGSATPPTGRSTPLLRALEANDAAGLDAFASYLAAVLGDQVQRVLVLDRAGRVAAAAPTVARPGADYASRDLFTAVSTASPRLISNLYLTAAGGGSMGASGDAPVIGVSSLVTDIHGVRAGVVVTEVDLHLLGRALTPQLGVADDLYLIDRDGHLLLRATHAFTPDSAFERDLRGSIAAQAALSGTSRIEADDPLGGGRRLFGIGSVSARGWLVLAMRSPAALEAELEGLLTQGRVARIALAIVLVLGAALFAQTAGRARAVRSR